VIEFGQALKATRRGIHQHGPAWRCAIIVNPRYQRTFFHDELLPILHGSSLKVELVQHVTLTVRTEKGGIIRVFGVNDMLDAYACFSGGQFTQLIWTHEPERNGDVVRKYVATTLRSLIVPVEALRNDDSFI